MNSVAYWPRVMQTIVAINQCLRFIWGDPTLIQTLLGGDFVTPKHIQLLMSKNPAATDMVDFP